MTTYALVGLVPAGAFCWCTHNHTGAVIVRYLCSKVNVLLRRIAYLTIILRMKTLTSLLAVAAITGLFLNCSTTEQHQIIVPDFKTSLTPDSFIIISLKGISVGKFAFPPTDKDKIWITEADRPNEIDLKTGSVTPLSQKLGAWCDKRILANDWASDPYDSVQIWFAQFHAGVQRWNRQTGQTTHFPEAQPATCFAFQPKVVWIGTAKGLWRYDRATQTTTAEPNFPSIWVSRLSMKQDSLFVNGQHCFLPSESRYEERLVPWADDFCRRFDYSVYQHGHTLLSGEGDNGERVNFIWTKAGHLFKFGNEFVVRWSVALKNEVWARDAWGNVKSLNLTTGEMRSYGQPPTHRPEPFAANQHYVFCHANGDWVVLNKQTGEFRVIAQGNTPSPRHMEIDDRNLYLLYNEQFKIINIEWLVSRAASSEQYAQGEAWYNDIQTECQMSNYRQFYPALARYDSLTAKYGNSGDDRIDRCLWSAWQYVVDNLERSRTDTIALVTKDMANGRFSRLQQRSLAAGLFRHYGREAQLKKAQRWGQRYIALLDSSEVDLGRYVERSLKAVQRAAFQFDSLDRYTLLPDARLFAEAEILLEYCYNSLFFEGNVCYDIRLATSKWEQIIKKYPQSTWADNAEFQLLEHLCYGCGGGPGPEEIRRYAAILNRHPDSELRPQIWMMLAAWHLPSDQYDFEWQEKTPSLQGAKRAEQYLDSIKIAFPEQTKEERFKALQDEIGHVRERYTWKITAAPEKTEVRPGEPVRVVVSFKNNGRDSRQLSLWQQGYCMLSFDPTYLSQQGCEAVRAPFFEVEKPSVVDKNVTVKPGQTHREVVEISKLVNKRGQFGRFDFSKKGTYDIHFEIYQSDWGQHSQRSSVQVTVL